MVRRGILGAVVSSLLLLALSEGTPAQALPGNGYALDNGDVNGDWERDLSDGISLLGYLFSGGAEPVPLALCGTEPTTTPNGDTNADGTIDVSDPILLLGWLFSGGPAPVPPCGEGFGGARNANPRVIPPQAKPHGRTYGDWNAAWWQWGLGIDKDVNPITDPDGSFCAEGQSGSVWFLAGTFGGDTVRSCTVPAGKTLIIPLLNQTTWTPEDYDYAVANGVPGGTVEEVLRNFSATLVGAATHLGCTVDGVELQNLWDYRSISSRAFPLFLGPDNVLGGFGYPDGLRETAVFDGYYVILAPLPAGEHTVTIESAATCTPEVCFGLAYDFALTVTYHLTVGK